MELVAEQNAGFSLVEAQHRVMADFIVSYNVGSVVGHFMRWISVTIMGVSLGPGQRH